MADVLFSAKSGMPSIPSKISAPPPGKFGVPIFGKPSAPKPGGPPSFIPKAGFPKPAPAINESEFEKLRSKVEDIRTSLDSEVQKRESAIEKKAIAECEGVRKRLQTAGEAAIERIGQARTAVDTEWNETVSVAQTTYEYSQRPAPSGAPKQENRSESTAALRDLTEEIAGISAGFEGRVSETIKKFSDETEGEINGFSEFATQAWNEFYSEIIQASTKLENLKAGLGKA